MKTRKLGSSKKDLVTGNRAQVSIFIILAIVIVAGIILFFAFRGNFTESIPKDIRPVYDYYLSCIDDTTQSGINLLGSQGGYIELPDFEAGSAYSPFSNQLDFMGSAVPYWMYVSGNNFLKEQVPTKDSMQIELENYVGERLTDCDFSEFSRQGYEIFVDEGIVDVEIRENEVLLDVKNSVTIFYHNSSAKINEHKIEKTSKLGKFYDMALKVYNYEKTEMFLEKYALDVMRLYAPVTGAELSCTPKIFVDSEIQNDIQQGLVDNLATLKLNGDYYGLSNSEREYFVADPGFKVDENVNFMYAPNWPTRIEIYGDRVAEPIGIQEGLAVLGFCYIPYQLIYDINFPVMVQFYDENELFQFPVAVVIDNNQARKALPTTSGVSIESRVCEFQNQEVDIYTYDIEFNPVEARVRFRCLDATCDVGETELGNGVAYLDGKLPQCVNGFITATAEGYADAKYQISTNEETLANVILSKKYNVSLDLGNVDSALITFSGEDYSTTVLYPEMSSVELIEDYYNVSVYAYDNSSLKFPAINERKCVDVPESGLAGLMGGEIEKCYDINIPEMDVSFAVVGGGVTQEYITSGMLRDSNELNINVPLFGVPANLEEMQENHEAAQEEIIYLEFE